MTSTGTYAFNPSAADAMTLAYARIGVRRTAITNEHINDALFEGNLLLTEWASKQPLLWKSETITQALTESTATYTLPARVVMVLIAYIQTTASGSIPQSRVLGPLSTVEYASIPNKTSEAPPTSFWLNRQITPTMTLWPVPDDGGPYTLYMQVVSQIEDVSLPSGATLNLPNRAMDAYVAGLAYRLARIHAPQLEDKRKVNADEAWAVFSGNDVENVPFYLAPAIGAYRG